ncbi:hypothetical protein OHR86_28190 [Streptomyces sp. NBC_00441]|uniref:hypothetical protein n=1 Tax=Streptomyces sp. NBC_00441 TaxID=2975742 RepID=UPI002E2B1A04|nr:hypothetical protein [Streptomyces sp. NBC_00441]
MTTAPYPAASAKDQTVRDWHSTHPGRPYRVEKLTDWTTTRLDDGALLVSARVVGPNPGAALEEFGNRHAERLGHRVKPAEGDLPPIFDVSVPGRTARVWRVGGVWVEVWHPNTPNPVPGPPRCAQRVPRPVPSQAARRPAAVTPSGRLPLGERLTRMRRALNLKEN